MARSSGPGSLAGVVVLRGLHPLSRPAAACVLMVAAAALLAGCGSYTKRDLVAQANAICASTVRATRALAPPAFAGSSTAGELHALADYLARALPLLRSEARQLQALRQPTEGRRQAAALRRYVAAMAASVSGFAALQAAAARDDAAGVASAERALSADPVASLAAASGLKSCGNPGATIQ